MIEETQCFRDTELRDHRRIRGQQEMRTSFPLLQGCRSALGRTSGGREDLHPPTELTDSKMTRGRRKGLVTSTTPNALRTLRRPRKLAEEQSKTGVRSWRTRAPQTRRMEWRRQMRSGSVGSPVTSGVKPFPPPFFFSSNRNSASQVDFTADLP